MQIVKSNNSASAVNIAQARSRHRSVITTSDGHPAAERQDLLHRFISTPHTIHLQLMQRTVRLETNHESVLELARKFFETHQHGKVQNPQFLWRIVCESDPQMQSTAVPLLAFSDKAIRYVNIGQRGFLAVDLDRREAIAILSTPFLKDDPRFRHRPPLDILFCMTAASLRLTALSGACVGLNGRAVLIFGPPNSGKTTASYLAAKRDLEFHADQVVFLDTSQEVLHVWGDPFPAVFRPATVEFLPELREGGRRSSYADLSFYYFDKFVLQPRWAPPLVPVCSLFLERETTSVAHLTQISPQAALDRLKDSMLFKEGTRFDHQVSTALTALAARPAYRLQYSSDPKIAADVIEEMLR